MKIDKSLLDKLEDLSCIEITQIEKENFLIQLSDVLNYINKINDINTDNIEPSFQVIPTVNVFRQDREYDQRLKIDEISLMAPDFEEGYFKLPKIL